MATAVSMSLSEIPRSSKVTAGVTPHQNAQPILNVANEVQYETQSFRFGDRGGRRMILMPSRTRKLRKASEYLVSLSRMRHRLPRRNPSSMSVRLRATCIIQDVPG